MVLIIGDSHTRILAHGQETLPHSAPAHDYNIAMVGIGRTFLKKFYVETADEVTFRAKKRQEILNDLTGKPTIDKRDTTVFLSLGFHGVYLYNSSLWNDFTLSHDDKTRHYISDAAFKQMVIRFNYHILGFIKSLRKIGITPVVIAAPFLPQKFIANPKIKSMTPSELQLIQTRYRTIFSNVLQAQKVPVIAPPADAISDGYLMGKYLRSDDLSEYHGNPEYGCMVLKQVHEFLANPVQNPART